MMKMPLISVIVPIYNVELYLERCVNSLINQTLQEIEIILVNDGSTDNSEKIMLELTTKDNRIKAFTKINGGLSDARNFGIQHSLGDFLAFVDSDDWIDENMLKKMYELAFLNNCEVVICNLQKVNEHGIAFRKLEQMQLKQNEIVDLKEDFSSFGEISWFACNKIFKRKLFDTIEFTKSLHFEDIATIPRLVLKSKKIGFCQEYFYQYFEREGSITRNFTKKGLDMFKAIQIVETEFQNSDFKSNREEWRRFLILNGFYSFLAYVAQVKDKKLKNEMYLEFTNFISINKISKLEIIEYKRFNYNYLLSLPIKKKVYYLLTLIGFKL
jgi:glycosyltransferase involved in cell wall biosynthesis